MSSNKNIVIISGAPGSGKSTLGRLVAKQLGVPFIDKDDFLESLFGSLGIGALLNKAR